MSRSLVKIGVEEETGLVDDLLDATSDGDFWLWTLKTFMKIEIIIASSPVRGS